MRTTKARGVACPECGDPIAAVSNSNEDQEGNRIRLRLCQNCRTYFTTVEVAVPGFSFHRAKASRDRWQRMTREYLKVSEVSGGLKLEVVPASPIKRCRRGLHDMAGENVGYNGRDKSKRFCMACKRQGQQVLYHYGRQKAPPAILEEQRAYWREQKRRQARRAA